MICKLKPKVVPIWFCQERPKITFWSLAAELTHTGSKKVYFFGFLQESDKIMRFLLKTKGSTLMIFSKKARNHVLSSSRWLPSRFSWNFRTKSEVFSTLRILSKKAKIPIFWVWIGLKSQNVSHKARSFLGILHESGKIMRF